MKSIYACGVDIGGSHITAAIIELADNTILKDTVKRASIDSSKTVTEIINDWTAVIKDVLITANGKKLNIGIAYFPANLTAQKADLLKADSNACLAPCFSIV